MDHPTTQRRYDVDWLRVFATYTLFVFHTGKVFDVAPFYHIKNAQLSPGLGYLTGFIHQWHMPLFFLLAGWSVFGSLRHRGSVVMTLAAYRFVVRPVGVLRVLFGMKARPTSGRLPPRLANSVSPA